MPILQRTSSEQPEAKEKDPSQESDEAQTTVTALLDWDSAEDPGDPKNWSIAKRLFHTAIPGFFGFSV